MAEPDVDENGEPETPAKEAVEKRKHRNLTYLGIGVGVAGLLLAIYRARSSSSASTGTSANYPLTSGMVAGAGAGDPSASGGTQADAQYSALAQQLSDSETAQLNALNALTGRFAALQAELNATHGPATKPPPSSGPLPSVNPSWFAAKLPGNTHMDILGTETSHGYVGANVRGGAPVYALVNGFWEQGSASGGIAPNRAPAGTVFATQQQFDQYIFGPRPESHSGSPAPVANPPHAPLTRV